MSSVAILRRTPDDSRDNRRAVGSCIFLSACIAAVAGALYLLLRNVTEDKVRTAIYSFEHFPTQSGDAFRR